MTFELNPKIKVVLQSEDGNLVHIFRVPNSEEWKKYNSMKYRGTKSTFSRESGSEISFDLSDSASLDAAEALWNACCTNIEGYTYDGEPLGAGTKDWQEKVLLAHKVAAINKFMEIIEDIKRVQEKN